ncbi:MAG: protein-L-isoaspartate O-methyltransferase [Thiohalomonadaceae bacterium]
MQKLMPDVNFELARRNMIAQQVRPWDVLNDRVLDAMQHVPREDFVPAQYRNLAYTDLELPIGQDQVLMAPKLVGRMLQALDIQARDRVLEVGTGTGYATALMALLANEGHVYSVDLHAEFTAGARQRLAAHGIRNVTLETGNAVNGWDAHEPYDAIAITGSLPLLTDGFQRIRESLAVGGRLFVVVGEAPSMEAILVTRMAENEWRSEGLFETLLPPLVHAPQPQRFVF